MTDLTPEQRIDEVLDWKTHLLIRESVVQDLVDTKNIHITEEMLMTAKNEAKQQLLELKKKWENDELKMLLDNTTQNNEALDYIQKRSNQLNGGK